MAARVRVCTRALTDVRSILMLIIRHKIHAWRCREHLRSCSLPTAWDSIVMIVLVHVEITS